MWIIIITMKTKRASVKLMFLRRFFRNTFTYMANIILRLLASADKRIHHLNRKSKHSGYVHLLCAVYIM